MMAPLVARVFNVESLHLMERATNEPPAATKSDKRNATQDHLPKMPTSAPANKQGNYTIQAESFSPKCLAEEDQS